MHSVAFVPFSRVRQGFTFPQTAAQPLSSSKSVRFSRGEDPFQTLKPDLPILHYEVNAPEGDRLAISSTHPDPEKRLSRLNREVAAIAWEKSCNVDDVAVAEALEQRARTLVPGDEFRLTRALAIREKHQGRLHAKTAAVHLQLAELYERHKQPQVKLEHPMTQSQEKEFNQIALSRTYEARKHYYAALAGYEAQPLRQPDGEANLHLKLAEGYMWELMGPDHSNYGLTLSTARMANDTKRNVYALTAEKHFKKAYAVYTSTPYASPEKEEKSTNGLAYIYTLSNRPKELAVLMTTITERQMGQRVSELRNQLTTASKQLQKAQTDKRNAEKKLGQSFDDLLKPDP